jgi:hypothetical protein
MLFSILFAAGKRHAGSDLLPLENVPSADPVAACLLVPLFLLFLWLVGTRMSAQFLSGCTTIASAKYIRKLLAGVLLSFSLSSASAPICDVILLLVSRIQHNCSPALSLTGCKPSPFFVSLTRLVTTQDCTWTRYFIGHVGNMRAGRLGQGLNCVCVAAGVLLAHYLLEI